MNLLQSFSRLLSPYRILKSLDNICEFWKKNYFVNEMDNFERFQLFLKKNPNLSVLMEDNRKIIGTVLGSFDGRRGYLQKVATKKDARRKGIGEQLVKEVIKRLRALGVLYIPINCEEANIPFYEKCGFKKQNRFL